MSCPVNRARASLLLSLTLVAAPAWAAGRTARLGDLTVTVTPAPDPPRAGENRLELALADPTGAPVDGAKLALVWDMPAMGAMPEMRGRGAVQAAGKGRYVVGYPLSMEGDWFLTLSIEAPGRPPRELKMKAATGRSGIAIEETDPSTANAIVVSPARQQLIGVTFGTVEPRPLATTLRAAGRVEVDERNLAEVTLKYEAFVQKLFVAETGKSVRRGQPLAVLYSPDLLSAEEELLAARRAGAAAPLAGGLERRLAYWDLTPAQLQAVEKSGHADGRVTIVAPASGVVIEKNVVEGARVEPGTSLYRIGNLGRVWVQAAVAERDASFVSVGQPARVRLPALPEPLDARVAFVAPTVNDKTRTIEARLEIRNPRLALKPGMFVDVQIDAPLGSRLSVPDSALLLSGEHRYVFVDRGGGRLQPVEVEVGAQAGDFAEVRSGLAAGDRVATGATFLLSSEAKLRDVLPRWGGR
ncbi:MAG TPA: efflux RND transporter periplasmic adaptor subunit [Polyangia bacterium]|nr:efflux RND transporter periplasmic adaptor subunit [Polyangia bacterium]